MATGIENENQNGCSEKRWPLIQYSITENIMGMNGAKLTKKATTTSKWLEESLSGLGMISLRKMFGGYGIFENGVMFALITSAGIVHFKANENDLERYRQPDILSGTYSHQLGDS